jgi:hypothetical protein
MEYGDLKEVLLSERDILRNELIKLKECQVRYFWSSITATGLLLGIGGSLRSDIISTIIFVAPLFIVLPCWVIFYDKATTITRIVGYLRILEYMIIGDERNKYAYIGWENALSLFRKSSGSNKDVNEDVNKDRFKKYINDSIRGLKSFKIFEARTRYWHLSWLTFLLLSIFCLFLGFYYMRSVYSIEFVVWIAFLLLTIIAGIHSIYILSNLIDAKYSYNHKESTWKKLLTSSEARNYFTTNF